MRNVYKTVLALLCSFTVVFGSFSGVCAQTDSEISVLSENISSVKLAMAFNGGQAVCNLIVKGKPGISKITGTLKLYDNTAKKFVQSWKADKAGASCSISKSAAVLAGHKYTLSFTETVYDAKNVGEAVSGSTTRTN